jgi:hypothetical protein
MHLLIKNEEDLPELNWFKPDLAHINYKWKNPQQVETLPDLNKEIYIKTKLVGVYKIIFDSEIIRRHIMIKWDVIEFAYV